MRSVLSVACYCCHMCWPTPYKNYLAVQQRRKATYLDMGTTANKVEGRYRDTVPSTLCRSERLKSHRTKNCKWRSSTSTNDVSAQPMKFPLGNGLEANVSSSFCLPAWCGTKVENVAVQRTDSVKPHAAASGTDAEACIPHVDSAATSLALVTPPCTAPMSCVASLMTTDRAPTSVYLKTWNELHHRLQSVSLPLLLSSPDKFGLFSVAEVDQALCVLAEALQAVDSITRSTGLRMEHLFPAELVAALWRALPRFYDLLKRPPKEEKARCFGMMRRTARFNSRSLMKAFRTSRRALAVRTSDLASRFPMPLLIQLLVLMEYCGAISDDIIGPIGKQLLERHSMTSTGRDCWQHVSTNHLLSARFISSPVDTQLTLLDGDTAVGFACLLGRAQIVNHFHLHRLLHTIILPSVLPALEACKPTRDAMLELTACYIRYAVSGRAVTQLTELWGPYLAQMDLQQCAELLCIIGGRSRVSWKSKITTVISLGKRAAMGAEEDYFLLVNLVLERAVVLCSGIAQPMKTSTDVATTRHSAENCLAVTLARFICSLTLVNTDRWGEVYCIAATSMEHHLDTLPTNDTVSLSKAILKRGSLLPYHPLHRRLVCRLLTDKAALVELSVASVALLSAALMLPPSSPLAATGNVLSRELTAAQIVEPSCALAVFRRHGTKLGLRSFVAGICASNLAELPRRSQERVIAHFTSLVSGIGVSWLARGIAALTAKIPDAVDIVSVQRWFSRFTASDVVRQLDTEHTSMLLNVLGREDYSQVCALAKKAITAHASRLLLKENISTDKVKGLVLALQQSNVLFPFLYSRVCRLLLSNIQRSPYDMLLPLFHVAADEFTRCKHCSGSVFRDVWEGLRRRLMVEAASLLMDADIATALNGFSALDVGDYNLFSVLVHRMWIRFQEIAAHRHASTSPEGAASRLAVPTEASGGNYPMVWVDSVLSTCTPSALAAIVCTLVHVGEGETVYTFMPWILLRLRPCVCDLYPIDVLHLMPALLSMFVIADTPVQETVCTMPTWPREPVDVRLLHAVYDACRELFLRMYEAADGGTGSQDAVLPKSAPPQQEGWSGKVRVSVSTVPSHHFAKLLVALCQSGTHDELVSVACAARVTSRCCAVLPISLLVDVTMALCFHFPPSVHGSVDGLPRQDAATSNAPADIGGAGDVRTGPSTTCDDETVSRNCQFLLPALNALWKRIEELNVAQVHAIVRCLKHYYGDRVDKDFLERLEQHIAAVTEVRQRCVHEDKEEHKVVDAETAITPADLFAS